MVASVVLRVAARLAVRLIGVVRRRPVVSGVALALFVIPAAVAWYLGTTTPVLPPPTTGSIGDAVAVSVRQVVRNPATNAMALVLQEDGGARLLILTIGDAEANAIAQKLSGQPPPRPLTADVVVSVVDRLGGRVKRVDIAGSSGTFYTAQLMLDSSNGTVEIDCRPSDCIAVALRAGAPIYVARTVLDDSGIFPSDLK